MGCWRGGRGPHRGLPGRTHWRCRLCEVIEEKEAFTDARFTDARFAGKGVADLAFEGSVAAPS